MLPYVLSGTNPCRKLKCNKFKRCNITHGVAECVCPTYCEPVLRPVCGSDGITYDNECQLQKDACQNEHHVTIKQRGPCGIKRPCLNHHCNFYGVCVVRDGRAECDCPTCSEEFDPVCGMNGISYMNECKLKLENCQKRSDVQVKHKGLCNGCENKKCHFYAVCQSDGKNARCVCPSACVEVENKVCGTDRITYQNECELKVASCRDQKLIEVESRGDCDKCAKVRCPFGSTCEDGDCVCPQVCAADFEPLCASNGQIYTNECEMKKDACLKKTELYIVNNGPCDEISGSGLVDGSGSGSICDETSCKFGGTCELSEGSTYRCTCKNSCDAIRSLVCGSDGRTYSNECMMKLESCHQQREISSVSIENCEDLEEEEPCDGNMPLVNPLTGQEYNCFNNKNICPPGSYCHKRSTFAKCCREVIAGCNDTPFGCCEDNVTIAKGFQLAGCPTTGRLAPTKKELHRIRNDIIKHSESYNSFSFTLFLYFKFFSSFLCFSSFLYHSLFFSLSFSLLFFIILSSLLYHSLLFFFMLLFFFLILIPFQCFIFLLSFFCLSPLMSSMFYSLLFITTSLSLSLSYSLSHFLLISFSLLLSLSQPLLNSFFLISFSLSPSQSLLLSFTLFYSFNFLSLIYLIYHSIIQSMFYTIFSLLVLFSLSLSFTLFFSLHFLSLSHSFNLLSLSFTSCI
ncbi:unnamed protein product [Acanthosepion pharaonis]|uniref:Kazal-like domain-containing protein n=1 Tax=Acanthosepion pharaonis TaxID=158019 RepID=A0A812CP44_ACAPH|nr:unnamed protein product [Sepia pharaonis]